MAEIVSLADGVAVVVHDGDSLAMEGFTHLTPFAAGHEVLRQGRRELTLARMTPDVLYDQLIGAGCARRLVFSWGGNPGVGSLHRFRDAVQNQWPVPLEVDFVTSVGYGTGPGERERLGLTGAGPRLVITDLGILEPDPDSCELILTRLHPGASLDKARQATGWPLAVAGDLTTTDPPSQQELEVLRGLEGSMV